MTLPLAAAVALIVILVSYLAFGAEALTVRALAAEFVVALVIALPLGLLRAHRDWRTQVAVT